MSNIITKNNKTLWIVACASLVVPFILPNRYFQDIAILTLLWAGLASAWNMYSGYCGRMSIGHAAFMGIGAYTSTLLYLNYGISPWIGMLAGGALAAVVALIIGGCTLRLQGTFFVLSTIAFAEILKTIVITSTDITAGSLGLMIPHNPGLSNMIFDDKIPFAIITWVYMMVVIGLCVKLEQSKLGYSLIALGQDREAVENLGINSTAVMLKAYVASAVLTSFGGTLFAQYIMFIEPNNLMGLAISVNFILYAVAGGMGKAFGPMIGAFLLVPFTNILRGSLTTVNGLHGLLLGLILVLILIYKPQGILPQITDLVNRKLAKSKTKAKEGE